MKLEWIAYIAGDIFMIGNTDQHPYTTCAKSLKMNQIISKSSTGFVRQMLIEWCLQPLVDAVRDCATTSASWLPIWVNTRSACASIPPSGKANACLLLADMDDVATSWYEMLSIWRLCQAQECIRGFDLWPRLCFSALWIYCDLRCIRACAAASP